MDRYLMILEVSQKQAYIFGSRKLRDNLLRSEEIRYVTSPEFFRTCCPEKFLEEDNLVYAGGGHTVLQFDDQNTAKAFAAAVTEQVLRQFPYMEMFVKLNAYDPLKSCGENLISLASALEDKKARRKASFYARSFGIDTEQQPVDYYEPLPLPKSYVPAGWTLTNDGDQLAGEDNYLAIVHIDGNAMGARVQNVYEKAGSDWNSCAKMLHEFSREINRHFGEAYEDMTDELARQLIELGWDAEKHKFPVRKVIGAGDDVCFITAGRFGLGCAASFLRHLSKRGYTACAGVCVVHKRYPFHAAYDLSEALCSNAKVFGASIDGSGGISAIDWHIEFGQLKESLGRIREDYITDDGAHMEMRPYAVCGKNVPLERQFGFFAAVLAQLCANSEKLPRGKVKLLREAFKQGQVETRLALRMANMESLLYVGIEKRRPDWLEWTLQHGSMEKDAFYTDTEGERRCLFFDAIEAMDHTTLWGDYQ